MKQAQDELTNGKNRVVELEDTLPQQEIRQLLELSNGQPHQLKELQEKINDYRNKCQFLEKENMEHKADRLQTKELVLQALQEKDDEIEQLRVQIQLLSQFSKNNQKNSDVELQDLEALREMETNYNLVMNELNKTKEENFELVSEIQSIRNRHEVNLRELGDEINLLKAEIQEKIKERDQIREHYSINQGDKTLYLEEIKDLEEKLLRSESRCILLEEQLRIKEKGIIEKQNEIEEKNKKIKILDNSIKDSDQEKIMYEKKLIEQMKKYLIQINIAEEKVRKTEAELKSIQDKQSSNEWAGNPENDRITSGGLEDIQLNKEMMIQTLKDEIQILKTELTESKLRENTLTGELEVSKIERSSLERNIAILQSEFFRELDFLRKTVEIAESMAAEAKLNFADMATQKDYYFLKLKQAQYELKKKQDLKQFLSREKRRFSLNTLKIILQHFFDLQMFRLKDIFSFQTIFNKIFSTYIEFHFRKISSILFSHWNSNFNSCSFKKSNLIDTLRIVFSNTFLNSSNTDLQNSNADFCRKVLKVVNSRVVPAQFTTKGSSCIVIEFGSCFSFFPFILFCYGCQGLFSFPSLRDVISVIIFYLSMKNVFNGKPGHFFCWHLSVLLSIIIPVFLVFNKVFKLACFF